VRERSSGRVDGLDRLREHADTIDGHDVAAQGDHVAGDGTDTLEDRLRLARTVTDAEVSPGAAEGGNRGG